MTNKELKDELLGAIFKLMPANKVAAEIAERSNLSPQYVYKWMGSDLIHKQMEKAAQDLLVDLRLEAKEILQQIKTA